MRKRWMAWPWIPAAVWLGTGSLAAEPARVPLKDPTALYDLLPDLSRCRQGILKEGERKAALNRINVHRERHGLRPVRQEVVSEILADKAVLVVGANQSLDHQFKPEGRCFSETGATGSSRALFYLHQATTEPWAPETAAIIDSWLVDAESANLGHRRWLLNPFLAGVAFSRIDGRPVDAGKWAYATAAALVMASDGQVPFSGLEFVAYPFHELPSVLFPGDGYHSLSVLVAPGDYGENREVDYASATIEITDWRAVALPVQGVAFDQEGIGLPNLLKWKFADLHRGERYGVTVKGVKVKGQSKSFSYWFRID